MDRRKFLESMAVLGAGSLALSASGAERLGRFALGVSRKKEKPQEFDENLVCILSDLHVRPGGYQEKYFKSAIDDVLAFCPLPSYVLALGDIAYLTGRPEEYAAAKAQLDRLTDAGIRYTLAMGNHDRRANFAEAFPELAAASELPDRYVFTVRTKRADFLLLDSLQEGEDTKKWITPGALNDEEIEWLRSKLATYTGDKPVFVMAHHPLDEVKIGKLLMEYPCCRGYIYGHKHIWNPGWVHVNYKDRTMLRTLCVPSTGHWGDIGFVTLRLEKDRAVATLHEREFFFPYPVKEGEERPPVWDEIEREHRGATCEFPFA